MPVKVIETEIGRIIVENTEEDMAELCGSDELYRLLAHVWLTEIEEEP